MVPCRTGHSTGDIIGYNLGNSRKATMLITFALLKSQITLAMWSDIATIAAAAGTLLAALFALCAICQTRNLTKQKAQPYVAASLEPHQHVPWVMELVVANYGQTAATNVHITIDPDPLRAVLKNPGSDGPTNETPLHYPKTLSVLVPGQRWGTTWDSIFMRHGRNELPTQYTITLTYDGIKGKRQPQTEYVLDWDMYSARGHLGYKTISNIGDDIAGIKKAMDKIVGPNLVHEVILRETEDRSHTRKS